jgi:hypothetical protein
LRQPWIYNTTLHWIFWWIFRCEVCCLSTKWSLPTSFPIYIWLSRVMFVAPLAAFPHPVVWGCLHTQFKICKAWIKRNVFSSFVIVSSWANLEEVCTHCTYYHLIAKRWPVLHPLQLCKCFGIYFYS